ncbi:hypothetical protein DL240_07375 [Lujinxingia litoralis]|uniref:Uncharacterized protein n=1 Tax=Lujinxingia litoralis TaxID=2211119 RepID=A0A328CD90_9DELT|nr:hypothetical protein [Lujinxingia litoralis]RAL23961.1 hypothetical protein DL240_07375 [Lujinxingia litoralis]
MRDKMWWMALLCGGALWAGGCGTDTVAEGTDSDVNAPDTDTTDGGPEDAADLGDLDADAPDVDGEDADGGAEPDADAEVDADADPDAGEEPWPCPSGHRVNKESGECESVPTLLVFTQDLQSYVGEELSSEMRGVLVCSSFSESAGRLPRETVDEGERCRVYGEYWSEVPETTYYDAGPITLFGLNGMNPAAFTAPSGQGSCYHPPQGLGGQFLFDQGAELRVMSPGSEGEFAFPGFDRTMQTLVADDFEHDALVPGEDLQVRWTPAEGASVVRIDVDARGSDGTHRTIICEVRNTGSYTIPAALTGYLPQERSSEFLMVEQSHTERIEPEDSEVLIMLSNTASTRKR